MEMVSFVKSKQRKIAIIIRNDKGIEHYVENPHNED